MIQVYAQGYLERYTGGELMNHLVSSVPSGVGRLLFLFIGYSCAALGGLLPKLWLRFSALLGAKLLSRWA